MKGINNNKGMKRCKDCGGFFYVELDEEDLEEIQSENPI